MCVCVCVCGLTELYFVIGHTVHAKMLISKGSLSNVIVLALVSGGAFTLSIGCLCIKQYTSKKFY